MKNPAKPCTKPLRGSRTASSQKSSSSKAWSTTLCLKPWNARKRNTSLRLSESRSAQTSPGSTKRLMTTERKVDFLFSGQANLVVWQLIFFSFFRFLFQVFYVLVFHISFFCLFKGCRRLMLSACRQRLITLFQFFTR